MRGAYYNEYDPDAAAWLRELVRRGLIADGEVDERSILDVDADDVRGFCQCHWFAGIGGWSYALRLAGWPDDRPVWTGSPPCQPFSVAGKQKGRDDARHLAPKFISLVGTARPGMLFGEQVASADVFGKAAKRAGGNFVAPPQWAWIDDLSDRLEAARYAVGASDFPSAGVGAPHIRQRTFFGAVSHEWLADAECSGADRENADKVGSPKSEPRLSRKLPLAVGENGRDDEWLGHPLVPGRQPEQDVVRGDGARMESSGCFAEQSSEAGSHAGGLADSDGAGRLSSPQPGIHRGQEGTGPRDGEPERPSDVGGMVHSIGAGLEGYGRHGDGIREPGRLDPHALGPDAGRSPTGRMGHGAGCGWREERQDGRGGAVGDRAEGISAGSGAGSSDLRTSPLHGFWRDADWLLCRDGKWRPVEPEVLGMVDGIPGCVVPSGPFVPASYPLAQGGRAARRRQRLRGYGNAINPHAAAEFIRAFAQVFSEAPHD